MIKLELTARPDRLTDELIQTKTEEYKNDKLKRVWDISWLKDEIFALSFGKCCFSEIRLGEESKYMNVEHYLPKSLFPDKVMEWGNLLPSCQFCNNKKGIHNTSLEPLVNPFTDDPKEHFYLEQALYCIKNKSSKAKLTIKKLGLNESELFTPRSRIAEYINNILEERYDDFVDSPEYYTKHIKRLKGLMKQGERKEQYAALTGTTILTNSYYVKIEQLLLDNSLWDQELTELKQELQFCALLKE